MAHPADLAVEVAVKANPKPTINRNRYSQAGPQKPGLSPTPPHARNRTSFHPERMRDKLTRNPPSGNREKTRTMTREQPKNGRNPDPHALNIARAVQTSVQPDLVILFGSRAAGDHREDSDIDILLVTCGENHTSSQLTAKKAAESYMRKHPPELELGIISMDRKTFDRRRLANQHVAGQAVIHGVIKSGEKLDHRYEYDNEYPEHWPETRQRVQNAEEWKHELDTMADTDHWNKKLIGLSAEQAVENALKGWLSTHNDTGRYGHDLDAAWNRIKDIENWEDWSNPHMEQIWESVQELFMAHTPTERHRR